MNKKSKKLVLIDGNAIIHRAYHALPPLTNKKGELLNAVYGFSSTILSVIDKFKPDYIIATFDLAGKTFRHKEFEGYKAQRKKSDQELYDQIPRVKEVTRAMGIPIFEKEGFEADDLIGTLVKKSEKRENLSDGEIENIIVTGDLDTLQLVSEKTKVYTMRRGITDSVLYDKEKIMERYGLFPEQLIDFKGLRGDPSDNIPGVKGVGEKTASDLLKKYQNLEGVYAHIGEIKGSLREKLEKDKMQAVKSKHLATIFCQVPVELNFDLAKTNGFDKEKLISLFQELNFFSLVKRISGSLGEKEKFSGKKEAGEVKNFKYEHIKENETEEFLGKILKEKEIAIELKISEEEKITGFAFSWKNGRVGYVENFKSQNLNFRKILESENVLKIGYDWKNKIKILKKNGFQIDGKLYDVLIATYVLNPGAKNDFPALVFEEIGEEIGEEKKKGQLGLEIETEQEVGEKICKKTDYVWKLKNIYEKRIKEISAEQKEGNNLEKIFWQLEMPLVWILSEMETNGVRLNTTIFQGISEKINARLKNLEKIIYDLAQTEFNINSPKQLAEILFEKLKISSLEIKKGKTGLSTASAELEKIKDKHKIIVKIIEYREIFKLKTTYLDALPLLVDENSRIHAKFNQTVTSTGRLSSSDPNLQNIPIRTELGQLLRVAFEAEKGFSLVSADYSQIDLRAVAHVSGDKKLIELFWKGEDIHLATAMEINKVSSSKVTEKMRSAAKALNFGIIYGMGVFGFSSSAGISREDAKKFIDAYFEKFSAVGEYIRKTKEGAKKKGFVETEMGRIRYVPEINSPNFQVASTGERMAINMPIQGMSADIVKLAMIKVYEEYKNNPEVKMILQIHDEIILEVREDLAEKVAIRMKEIMQNVYELKVPLVVDVKMGDNWGEI